MDFASSNAGRAKGFCNFNAYAFWAGENVSLSDWKFHKQATWCLPTKFPGKNLSWTEVYFPQRGEDLPTSASRWKVCKVDTWKQTKSVTVSCCIALHCLVGWTLWTGSIPAAHSGCNPSRVDLRYLRRNLWCGQKNTLGPGSNCKVNIEHKKNEKPPRIQ